MWKVASGIALFLFGRLSLFLLLSSSFNLDNKVYALGSSLSQTPDLSNHSLRSHSLLGRFYVCIVFNFDQFIQVNFASLTYTIRENPKTLRFDSLINSVLFEF